MDTRTRQQLLRLSTEFYAAHAEGFDASRGHQPWPGWLRLGEHLSRRTPEGPLRVLDIGCGNARLAAYLASGLSRPAAEPALEYFGIDANADLLAAGRARLPEDMRGRVRLEQGDFLAGPDPGAALPPGPFDLVALFGVLHHVPGRDWRIALLTAAGERVAPGGLLALAAWQFAGRDRFAKRTVAWADYTDPDGQPVDAAQLEAGDTLLRFGADPSRPPRYCHQVSDAEFGAYHDRLSASGPAFRILDEFRADGSTGDLNRYLILEKQAEPLPAT